MGLIEDFATWTERLHRKLLWESGAEGKSIHEKLPAGIPVSVQDAVDFLEALLAAKPSPDVAEKALRWKEKLCRATSSRHVPSSPR